VRLEEALNASSIGAAAFPLVEDIVYFRDGTTFWWLGTRYVDRDKPPRQAILEADGWHPYETTERLPKGTHGTRD